MFLGPNILMPTIRASGWVAIAPNRFVRNTCGSRRRACGSPTTGSPALPETIENLRSNDFSARVRLLSVSFARRSNTPMKRAEGDVRSVGTEFHNVYALQGKAPLGSREAARATCDFVHLRDR